MGFYQEMQSMANEMLKTFGDVDPVVLVRESPVGTASADPEPPVVTEYTVPSVIQLRYLDSVESSSLVLENNRGVVMSAYTVDGVLLPIIPAAGDKVITQVQGESVTWKVEAAAPVAPGGINILFKLEITR